MKVVIDIDEKDYDTIKNLSFYIPSERHGKRFIYIALNSIKNGTPLIEELEDVKSDMKSISSKYWSDNGYLCECVRRIDERIKREGESN